MATLNATKANYPANKGDYAGEYCIHTSYSSNTTVSAGDVVYACRLPVGVKVTRVLFTPGVAAGVTAVSKVGTSASAEAFITSAIHSAGTTVEANASYAHGFRISASDGAAVRYEPVMVQGLTVFSAGRWFDLTIYYVNDDDPNAG